MTIPVAQVNDGKAHFYSYDAGGTTVKYFVLADKNGKVRAALDACEVCFAQKKGYHQQGDAMVVQQLRQGVPQRPDQRHHRRLQPDPARQDASPAASSPSPPTASRQGVQYF